MEQLQKEIEPNLPAKDVQRLKRNVKRLGSFRAEWREESQDFLVKNATLAEFFILNYSRIKNLRLNTQLVETLTKFESYKDPEAIVAFSESLGENEKGKALLVPLFKKLIQQQSRVWPMLYSLIFSDWGQSLGEDLKLSLSNQACQAGAAFDFDQRQFLEALSSQSRSLWGRILSAELKSCLQRIS